MEKNTELSQLTINPTVLLANGYKKFNDGTKNSIWYMESYQKRFDDEHGRMFFINFTFSDRHRDDQIKDHFADYRYAWEADIQVNTVEDDLTINMQLFSCKKTLPQLEAFVKKMFYQMDFQYYEYGYQGLTHERHLEQTQIKQIKEEQNSLQNALSPTSDTPAKTLKI